MNICVESTKAYFINELIFALTVRRESTIYTMNSGFQLDSKSVNQGIGYALWVSHFNKEKYLYRSSIADSKFPANHLLNRWIFG